VVPRWTERKRQLKIAIPKEVAISLDELLDLARGTLCRLRPREVLRAMSCGAVLVDIRSESQRARDGSVPGAIPIPRNVLEWRCSPSSSSRYRRVSDPHTAC
jgi:hypothetical protein